MIDGVLLAVSAALIYGFLGLAFEISAKRNYPNWDYMFFKQLFGTLLGLACTLWLHLPFYRPELLWMALVGAVCYLATLWAYLTASRERDIAANWTILNLSVALPVLFSVFWFGDRFTALKVIGFGLTLMAIVLIGGLGTGRLPVSGRWTGWITVAFALNGWFVVLLRFVPAGYGPLFTFYFYGLSTLFAAIYKVAARERWSAPKGIYAVAALGAGSHWSGIMLTILALAAISRVSPQTGLIVYPITNGLPIVAGVIVGRLVLKQTVSRRTAWGIACGSVAMVFLCWNQ